MIPADAIVIFAVLALLLALLVGTLMHYYKRCPMCHSRMHRRQGRVRWKCTAYGCGYAEYSGDQI